MDELPVSMLADQNMSLSSTIGQGHHKLLPVPEGNNDMFTLTVQLINDLSTFRPDTQAPTEHTDEPSDDRRQQPQFDPVHHVL